MKTFPLGKLTILFFIAVVGSSSLKAQTSQKHPAKQCLTGTDKSCFPYESWVLTSITCDSGPVAYKLCKQHMGASFDYDRDENRQFETKAAAISWIEERPWLAPTELLHQGTFYPCYFPYLHPKAKGVKGLEKFVECISEREFDEEYCKEGCVWIS